MENTNDNVTKNLALMKGRKKGGMEALLLTESLGGNAGFMPDRRSCGATNFYFDKDSGDIKCFGNFQDVPEEIRSQYPLGTFRIAIDSARQYRLEIVETQLQENCPISETARQAIQRSVEMYNAEQNSFG
jgi:hypothetical protein